MPTFYDDLKHCEGSPHAPGVACPFAFPVIEKAYPRLSPWDKVAQRFTCPPGPEPDPPETVAARAANAVMLSLFATLSDEARAELERYVTERYDEALAQWMARVEFCASIGQTGGPPPPAEQPPEQPPANGGRRFPPSTSPPTTPALRASPPVGWLMLAAGVAMMAASKR